MAGLKIKGLEALKDIFNHIYNKATTYEEDVKLNNDREIAEKDLKAFEIMKKYAFNDGWSNGWVIKFWDMNEEELEVVNEVLKNE